MMALKTTLLASQTTMPQPNLIIRAIHQENKGHGGSRIRGWRTQIGSNFKVVDSDRLGDVRAYLKILEQLQRFEETGEEVDIYYEFRL